MPTHPLGNKAKLVPSWHTKLCMVSTRPADDHTHRHPAECAPPGQSRRQSAASAPQAAAPPWPRPHQQWTARRGVRSRVVRRGRASRWRVAYAQAPMHTPTSTTSTGWHAYNATLCTLCGPRTVSTSPAGPPCVRICSMRSVRCGQACGQVQSATCAYELGRPAAAGLLPCTVPQHGS